MLLPDPLILGNLLIASHNAGDRNSYGHLYQFHIYQSMKYIEVISVVFYNNKKIMTDHYVLA